MSDTPSSAWATRTPLIAILRGIEPAEAIAQADALLEAGIDCIEVPTNSPQWQRSVEAIARHAGSRALVGAGTVWRDDQLQELVAAGGRLMVTPHTDPALVARAREQGLVTVIGCTTATEAFAALRAGAQVLKVFPASSLGPAHIGALRSVLPSGTSLFAVGGVRPDNLANFLRAGCVGVGAGSDLYLPGQTPRQTADKARMFLDALTAAQG
ncbi:MAG TPA: 2-dehydro-3-deoxy-6-phosphogalactonate aldolase [Albitalea sp.]|uniref:2-dehydro-3-deoxy-6-phosphogalactonate aldolase n=1 Tax=Piscinibacter sp. TaxID=1903157 RepID=UPI002ECFC804